jgi:hypothetical protein
MAMACLSGGRIAEASRLRLIANGTSPIETSFQEHNDQG